MTPPVSELAALLPPHLAQPLAACLEQLQAQGVSQVAIGLSGGPDSVALAAAVALLAPQHGLQVQAWHIHHGLMVQADDWQAAAQALGARLQIPVQVRAVQVSPDRQKRQGVEDAARQARYAAFAALAQEGSSACSHILLAQHLDDQAETVLFRLLRGSGPGGLAGMRPSAQRGALTLWRPWLRTPRREILEWATAVAAWAGISLADDPSNLDPQYARGALRQQVLPAIAQIWPAYRQVLARHAEQAAEMQEWLDEVVAHTLAGMNHDDVLDLAAWSCLPSSRARLVLRAWLASLGHRPPTAARLADLERQLRQIGPDAQLRWRHDERDFGVYRQGLYRLPEDSSAPPDLMRHWQREETWLAGAPPVPVLNFVWAEQGICPKWLAAMPLRLTWQGEGGRLRLQAGGPARALKTLFQELAVPPWERRRRPRLWRGPQLLWVAGVGQSADTPQASPGIRLAWPDDKPLQNAG